MDNEQKKNTSEEKAKQQMEKLKRKKKKFISAIREETKRIEQTIKDYEGDHV